MPSFAYAGKEQGLECTLISISSQFFYVIEMPVSSIPSRKCLMSFFLYSLLVCLFSAKWILPHLGSRTYPSIVSPHHLMTSSVTWWLSRWQWRHVLCIIRNFHNCLLIFMAHLDLKVFCKFLTLCVLLRTPLPWVRTSFTYAINAPLQSCGCLCVCERCGAENKRMRGLPRTWVYHCPLASQELPRVLGFSLPCSKSLSQRVLLSLWFVYFLVTWLDKL